MTKNELRKLYLSKRKSLTQEEVKSLSEQIIKRFIASFNPTAEQSVHCFISIPKFNEIETSTLINYCLDNGIKVFVPKVLNGKMISVAIDQNTQYSTSQWGISEPTSNQDTDFLHYDFVITPLLYCDALGNRIGYGKGFYDDFFAKISQNTKKIGVSFFPPQEKIDDVRSEDIRLDYLITPEEVLSFGKS
ncbi:MAG: 5-formyltetrahydrofolate cyclo-ligase [Bergeyella zoohelcum]|nr:5-formyltetrahydrofolate cyclo-ligase [Bergeyella zoohelcum]